ncbi:MAG: glutamine amidotransferase [Actinomycetes bacterium]
MLSELKTLRVAVLYPTLLNIYADRGNIEFLRRRCEWRGISFEVTPVGVGDELEERSFDLVYVGGGQDRDQVRCGEDLKGRKADVLGDWIGRGRPLLAVCGGYQLLGHAYTGPGLEISGIGAIDATTTQGNDRLIGPIAIRTDLGGPTGGVLAGFENHAGRTALSSGTSPLGTVLKGHGNDGSSGLEGARIGASIATYLHGPLLPKNWWLADWLIARSLGLELEDLPQLDDSLEIAAHRVARTAAGVEWADAPAF